MNYNKSSYNKGSAARGAAAIAAFKNKLLKERNLKLISIEGSRKDLEEGVDYELYNESGVKLREGSHRHWPAYPSVGQGCANIRFTRNTGAKTDFHKIEGKPDNYIYSFSFGNISEGMKIYAVTARSLRSWIDKNRKNLKNYETWPFGINDNSFLSIPFKQLEGFKIF